MANKTQAKSAETPHNTPGQLLNWQTFLQLKQSKRKGVFVETANVMLIGDAGAALLLDQIIYWNEPDKQGKTKLRVLKEGKLWLAKSLEDWYQEIGLTAGQARGCINKLKKCDFVETKVFKFAGTPTTHIRVKDEVYLPAYLEQLSKMDAAKNTPLKPCDSSTCSFEQIAEPADSLTCSNEQIDLLNSTNPLTEITTEITSLSLLDSEVLQGGESEPEAKEREIDLNFSQEAKAGPKPVAGFSTIGAQMQEHLPEQLKPALKPVIDDAEAEQRRQARLAELNAQFAKEQERQAAEALVKAKQAEMAQSSEEREGASADKDQGVQANSQSEKQAAPIANASEVPPGSAPPPTDVKSRLNQRLAAFGKQLEGESRMFRPVEAMTDKVSWEQRDHVVSEQDFEVRQSKVKSQQAASIAQAGGSVVIKAEDIARFEQLIDSPKKLFNELYKECILDTKPPAAAKEQELKDSRYFNGWYRFLQQQGRDVREVLINAFLECKGKARGLAFVKNKFNQLLDGAQMGVQYA